MTMVILRSEKPGERSLRDRQRTVIQALEWQVRVGPQTWKPPFDLFEKERAYQVRVEIAGMRQQEISIAIDGDLLVITGVRGDTPERRAFHQMEIRFGEFSVALILPGPVDEDSVSASYEDGFLLVSLPKAEISAE
jgi:HSP20 family protein